jgi:hypothetical protein
MSFEAADFLAGLFDGPAVPAAKAPDPEPAAGGPELQDPSGALVDNPTAPAAGGGQPALLGDSPEPAALPFADWVQAPDTRGRLGLQSPGAVVPWPAWEDLPEWSDNAPTEPAAGPCWWCGRREWWRSIHGAVVCGHCHPPAVPGLVAEWLNRSKPGPGGEPAAQEARGCVPVGLVDTRHPLADRPSEAVYGALAGRQDG